jgi:hypothetical protein
LWQTLYFLAGSTKTVNKNYTMSNMNNALMSFIIAKKQAEKYNVADPNKAATTGLLMGMMSDNPLMGFVISDAVIKKMEVKAAPAPTAASVPSPLEPFAPALEYSTNINQDVFLAQQIGFAQERLINLQAKRGWDKKIQSLSIAGLTDALPVYAPLLKKEELEKLKEYVVTQKSFSTDQFYRLASLTVQLNAFLQRAIDTLS